MSWSAADNETSFEREIFLFVENKAWKFDRGWFDLRVFDGCDRSVFVEAFVHFRRSCMNDIGSGGASEE